MGVFFFPGVAAIRRESTDTSGLWGGAGGEGRLASAQCLQIESTFNFPYFECGIASRGAPVT